MAVLAFILQLTVLFLLYKIYKRINEGTYKLPPGPRGLPIIGNNLQIAKNAPLQLSKWADEYGKLYTIRIGNYLPTLVISDVALIKQLFGSTASAGKFESVLFERAYDGSNGILNTEGKIWQEQREFMAKTLKRKFDLRTGTQHETTILTEAEHLGKWMEAEMRGKGEVVLSKILKQKSGNTLWRIITGENMSDADAHLLQNWMTALLKAAKSGLSFFSWIKYIAPEWSGYRPYDSACQELHKLVKRCFKDHEILASGENDGGGNIVSAYIEQMEKMKYNSESSFFGAKGYKQSVMSVNALIIAGTETSATLLHWLIFYLCVHPHVQKKVQQEIDEKIGVNRDPMLTDRKMMPYVEAVILETLRLSSLVPFGVIHRLLEDVSFGEYKLPKNLVLLPNLYHIHHDQKIWGDPENFRPERFLENLGGDGQRRVNNLKEFMAPFQAGRRICLGENLARDLIFLFITKLLQEFSFYPSPGVAKELYMKPEIGYFMVPQDLGIKISRRN